VTSPLARIAAFAAVLVLAAAGAAAVGSAFEDDVNVDDAPAHVAGASHGAAHGSAGASAPATLPGLAIAQDGLRLDLRTTSVARPGRTTIDVRIIGADGDAIRHFDVAHGRRMHLVLVRRDLAGFQHLHPRMDADGVWRTHARLPRAGTYRVFTDFTIDGDQHTLGSDLQVGGAFVPVPLPSPATSARSDHGADVQLRRSGDRFTFEVRRAGKVVTTALGTYLGAKGHLVTLRAGDLAYLHTHPDGDELAFESALPTPGRYRLWVQFRLDGVVHTAAFTQERGA
jgi:hypothetical protein